MQKSMSRGALRILLELAILIPCSMLIGFSIGTMQHYLAFGVREDGFGREAFQLATLEGGTLGSLFGIPTGLLTYYAVLRRHADARLITYIFASSLLGGCILGLLFYWYSAGLTPFLTMGAAAFLRQKQLEATTHTT